MKKLLLCATALLVSVFVFGQCSPGPIIGARGACVGTTTFFSDTTVGGVWSSSNPSVATIDSSTGVVSGRASGTTVISYTVCGSSTVTDTFTVDAAAPTFAYLSGPSIGCLGGSTVFSGSPSGGIFSSTDTSIMSIDPTSGMATGISPGTATIVYTCGNYCGSYSDSGSVLIYPFPSPGVIAGNYPLIIGDSERCVSVGGVSTGTWSISPAAIATISTMGVVTGLSAGMATLTYTDSTPCFMALVVADLFVGIGHHSVADSFTAAYSDLCSGLRIAVNTHLHVPVLLKTNYGDGSWDTTTITNDTSMVSTTLNHVYGTSGAYTVRQVMSASGVPFDSISYSVNHVSCRDISLSMFWDVDSNCNYDSSIDYVSGISSTVEVDSNGVSIDTISLTSGVFYRYYGSIGDVYRFRVLSSSYGISCPSSGIVYDTIPAGASSATTKRVALRWAASSGFDLGAYSTVLTGRHTVRGEITVRNMYNSTGANVTLNFDPRYSFQSATPTPSSVSGHTATWNFSRVLHGAVPVTIRYWLETPGGTSAWLMPGDIVRSIISVAPTSGDADTSNNIVVRIDTVKSSFDPNYTEVRPAGDILNGTKLHYTIHFENDGNDTATNIYVLDTLPDNVDPSTLRIETATAEMTVSYLRLGGHNVVKFDFPHIMLPDSSDHNLCTGFVAFNVIARTGLADGAVIPNRAGIYFDDNPVVMTNTVSSTIVVPTVSIASTSGDTICHGATKHFTATPHSVNTPHYQWYINTIPAGTDSFGFTTSSLVTGDIVKCRMTTTMDDTIISISNTITIVERTLSTGTISGPTAVCPAATITLTESVSGGTWSATNSRATISSGGVVSGVTAGLDTIIYTVSNVCATSTAVYPVTINPLPVAGVITGAATVCVGSSITLTGTATGGTWSVTNSHARVSSSGRVTGVSAGVDTVVYTVTNSCGTATATYIDTVLRLPSSGTITGAASICIGTPVTFTNSVSTGSWSVTNSRATISSTGLVNGITAGGDTVLYIDVTPCGRDTARHPITIIAVPRVSTISGPSHVCMGSSITLTDSVSGGTWRASNGHATISSAGLVNTVSAGLDTFFYSITNYCGTTTASHIDSILNIPDAGTIAGPSPTCVGATSCYRTSGATDTTGTWFILPARATYASRHDSTACFRFTSTGTSTLFYRLSNVCGADTAAFSVSSMDIPYAGTIAGPSSVCPASSITVTDSVAGGTWHVTNSRATISTSGSVMGISAGADTIYYVVGNFCGTDTTFRSLIINTTTYVADTISVNHNPVCAGDTVTFTVVPTNGGSSPFLQWKRFGMNVDTGTTYTYAPAVGDVITCDMTSSALCPSPLIATSNSITMVVNPLVTPTISIVASPGDSVTTPGQLITFFSTVTYGGSPTLYQWYERGAAVAGATSSSFSTHVISNDTVYCKVTSNIPCASSTTANSNMVVIYADYLGLGDVRSSIGSVVLYPNPNNGSFVLQGQLLNGERKLVVQVTDVVGRVLYERNFLTPADNFKEEIKLDDDIAPGIYFLKLGSGSETKVLRFTRE